MKTEKYLIGTVNKGNKAVMEITLEESGRVFSDDGTHYVILPPQVAHTIDILNTSAAVPILSGMGYDIGQPFDLQAATRSEVRLFGKHGERNVVFGTVQAITGPAIGAYIVRLVPQEVEGLPAAYEPIVLGAISMIDGRSNVYL